MKKMNKIKDKRIKYLVISALVTILMIIGLVFRISGIIIYFQLALLFLQLFLIQVDEKNFWRQAWEDEVSRNIMEKIEEYEKERVD